MFGILRILAPLAVSAVAVVLGTRPARAYSMTEEGFVIAIIVPSEREIAGILGEMENHHVVTVSRLDLHLGRWQGKDVAVVVAGEGMNNAVMATTILATRFFEVKYLLYLGTCGGSQSLTIGDMVLPNAVFLHDQGTVVDVEGGQPALSLYPRPQVVRPDAEFYQQVWTAAQGADLHGDTPRQCWAASGNQYVWSAGALKAIEAIAERTALAAGWLNLPRPPCVTVDMESYGVGAIAERLGLKRWAIVRVVTNAAKPQKGLLPRSWLQDIPLLQGWMAESGRREYGTEEMFGNLLAVTRSIVASVE